MLRRLEWLWSARIALAIFVTADVVGILVAVRSGDALTQVHEDRAAAIARGVEHRCHAAVIELDVTALRRCLDALWEEPDIARVAVESEHGDLLVEHRFGSSSDRAPRSKTAGASTVRYAATDRDGTVRAFVVVDVDEQATRRATRRARAEGLTAALGFTLLGVVLAAIATRRVVRPLRALATAETAIAQGDLTARVEVSTAAELGELASAFNGMVSAVQDRDERLVARGDELQASLAQVRALQATKESLTAMIVHDLRSPISAALSVLDVVDRQALPAEDRDMVELAGRRLQSALALAGDLLDVSRLESDALPIAREPFDLVALCRELGAAPWRRRDGAPVAVELVLDDPVELVLDDPVELVLDDPVELVLDDPLPPLVGDRRLIERAVSNLLSNAARYGGAAGRIRLVVRRAGAAVRIEVEDQGPGVPTEDRERIFRPFERGAAERGDGAGIGLALCAMVARAHGGSIRVEPAEPARAERPGARFVLELPA